MSETLVSRPISPLRRRMIEDMTVRQFVEKTQADYIRQERTPLSRNYRTIERFHSNRPCPRFAIGYAGDGLPNG
jgi:hypothetical protein